MTTLFKDLPLNKHFRVGDDVFLKVSDTHAHHVATLGSSPSFNLVRFHTYPARPNDPGVECQPNTIVEDAIEGFGDLFSPDLIRYQQCGSD